MPSADPPRPPPLANGLVYVNADMPGLRRVRDGESFRYQDAQGRWIDDEAELARIRRLAIPPAYTEVWICPLANGHLQATGIDARGRKQYRYHPDWRALKDEAKFERMEAFGAALPRIRARVARDLAPAAGRRRAAPLTRDVVLAAIVRLLDTTYLRVGNEEYASANGSYGLTTLRNRHAAVRGGTLKLHFRGKSGVVHEARLDDPRVAKIVRQCQQLPGQELFQYLDEEGGVHHVSSSDVNDYLHAAALPRRGGRPAAAADADGGGFTAKDFRTWHGTVQALELTRLACQASSAEGGTTAAARATARDILCAVARQLGNTPAVCRKAYIHPAVLALGTTLASPPPQGTQDVWARLAGGRRPRRGLYAAEHRLLRFFAVQRRARRRSAGRPQPFR